MRKRKIDFILLLLLFIGGLLRFSHIGYRSFWADESWHASVALGPFSNILSGSRGELGHPLQPGFAIVLWLWAHITGASSEVALRFLPALFGMTTILIAYAFAKKLWNRTTALFAAACASGWELLIHFSRELNQYSGTILLVFLLLFLAENFKSEPTMCKGIIFAITSFAIVIFSFQVATIAFSAYMILGLFFAFNSNARAKGIFPYIASALLFGFFGILAWLLVLRTQWITGLDTGGWGWRPCFISFSKLGALQEFLKSSVNYLALPYKTPQLLISIVGLSLWHKDASKKLLAYFFSAIFIGLALSALGLQPLCHRQILFVLPFLILGMAGLLGFIAEKLDIKRVGSFAVVVALFLAAPNVEKYVFAPQKLKAEESREVIKKLKEVCGDGDVLYVYYGGVYAFSYYGRGIGCKYYIGKNYRGEPNLYLEEIAPHIFEGKRFFIFFSHAMQSEFDHIIGYLQNLGDLKLVAADVGAAAFYLVPEQSRKDAVRDLNFLPPDKQTQPQRIWSYPKN